MATLSVRPYVASPNSTTELMWPESTAVVAARWRVTSRSWNETATAPSPRAGTQACAHTSREQTRTVRIQTAPVVATCQRSVVNISVPANYDVLACFALALRAFSISSRYLSGRSDDFNRQTICCDAAAGALVGNATYSGSGCVADEDTRASSLGASATSTRMTSNGRVFTFCSSSVQSSTIETA